MAQKPPDMWRQSQILRCRQGAGRSKVCLHLQFPLLLPVPYDALSPSTAQPIGSSRGRQHATIHPVLCPGCCSDFRPLVNAGRHHQLFLHRRTQGLFHQYHRCLRQVLVKYPAPLENTHHRWGSLQPFIHLHGKSLPLSPLQ